MRRLAKRSLAVFLAVIMLFSAMAVSVVAVSAETEFTKSVIYLQTNSQWRSLVVVGTDSEGKEIYDTARFAAYFYNDEGSQWVSAEAMEDDSITYTVAVPEGEWTNVIFCRMNPAYTENAWNGDQVSDRVWNQTENLTLSDEYDCFDITDWTTGQWSNYKDKFVYFVNTKGWQQVASYCRATTGYGGDIFPGKLCKVVDEELKVYSCKPGSYPLVMFNNYQFTGENTTTFDFREIAGKYIEPKTNMAYDTAEAAWEAADNYVEPTTTPDATDSTEEPAEFSLSRVFFDNSMTQWENVFIYGWANGLEGTFSMTQIEDTDFWYYDLPQPATAGVTYFLFKDTEIGWEDIHYTENVTVEVGYDCYKPEGHTYNDQGQLVNSYTWSVYLGEAPALPTVPVETVDPGVPMYFPACDPSWNTIFTALDSLGIDASYEYREKIAIANGIDDYTGTAEQNNLMLSLLKSGMLRNPEYVEPATTMPVPKEFTLIGNINGVDQGCESDHKSNPYIFDENGELTVTFYTMSYIYVKTTDQQNWYMFSDYTTENEGNLYLSSNTTMEKMGVPAGTHKFKLVENADGSLSISYITTSAPVVTVPTETVPAVECKELYLVANSNWTKDGARFAVYFYNYSGDKTWVDMAETTDSGVYKATIPEGDWTHIIYTRINPAYTENGWNTDTAKDRVWNQTDGMNLDRTLNTFTLKTKEFAGSWSYTDETVEPTEPDAPEKTAKLVLKNSLKAGKTTTAKVENADGKKVTFKTADNDIIKVNKKTGEVTALKKGTATVTAKVGDVTLTKIIKVTSDPKVKIGNSILSNNAKLTATKGKKITLKLTGKAPAVNNKVVLKNNKIGKITSKPNQEKIVIKAKKTGTSKLTITINNSKKYTFVVKVK